VDFNASIEWRNTMAPLMSPSEMAADVLVRAYLHGCTLPKILHGAVVWVAETRLSSGKLPVLDATLRGHRQPGHRAPAARSRARRHRMDERRNLDADAAPRSTVLRAFADANR
jgi:hypothetical protein